MLSAIFLGMLELFIFFLLGGFFAKINLLKKENIRDFSNFIVKVIYTFYIFSIIIKNLDVERLKTLQYLPLLGISVLLIGGGIGAIAQFGLRKPSLDEKKTFRALSAANNYGFLPIILVGRLWGDVAIANLFVIHLGCHFAMWTFAVAMLGSAKKRDLLKHLINPNVLAIVFAILIKVFGLDNYIPNFVFDIAYKIGKGAVPIVLIIIGANLYFSISSVKDNLWNLLYLTFFRLIIIPLVLVGFFYLLRLPTDIYNICVVISFMPVSSIMSVLTRIYGGDTNYASQAALFTHLAALITVPIGLSIFLIV